MFPRIIYVPGSIADNLGATRLQQMADEVAKVAECVVEVCAYGHSEYHSTRRYIGEPRDA